MYLSIIGILLNILRACIAKEMEDTRVTFRTMDVIPHLISNPPKQWCYVLFPSGTIFDAGKMVAAKAIRRKPEVAWDALRNHTYLLTMHGLNRYRTDAYYSMHFGRTYFHWMVVNIPGGYVEKGDEWYPFKKPLIPPNTMTDAYVILIYEQKHRLNVTDPKAVFGENFQNFPFLDDFAQQYNLSADPIAGNVARIRF